jgi:3-oxoacyl-[acyl-carrier protein] reductase
MNQLLEGKRCVVTGGTRGLGLAISMGLARHGAHVAMTYKNDDASAEEAAKIVREVGKEPLLFKGSVADSAHVRSTVETVVKTWGGIDALVNNAAITQVLPISLLEEADWDNVMGVNVKGVYLYSRAVLRHMIRARKGCILNIGNFASERIIEAPIHYAASKSALRGVNLLAPGLAEVGMAQGLPQHRQREYMQQCPTGRLAKPEEIAEMAAFMISDSSSFMSGAKVVLDGGL